MNAAGAAVKMPDLSNFSVFAQLGPASLCWLCLDKGATCRPDFTETLSFGSVVRARVPGINFHFSFLLYFCFGDFFFLLPLLCIES